MKTCRLNYLLVLSALILPVFVGCGSETSVNAIGAVVKIDALLADDTKAIRIFVLGPMTSDDIYLSRTQLMSREYLPDDPKVDLLASTQVAVINSVAPATLLKDISAGDYRLVYIEALDAFSNLIGNGCTEGVSVTADRTTEVSVSVYPV
ncbi:hypothetical protein KAI87_08560, partial [Myxococcota bacterium]|nr:hypothetical protein [Myxococcota bacterium]